MHIIVPFLQEVLSLVCPDKSMLAKWRREAAQSGFHEAISVPVPTTLDREVASELRGMDIEGLRLVDLQKLARILGVSASGRKAELKLSLAPLLQSINGFSFARTDTRTTHTTPTHPPRHTHTDTGTAVVSVDYPPIPWVFTKEQIALVDSRCKRIVLPPNCPAFCTTKAGIFEDPSSNWRLVDSH